MFRESSIEGVDRDLAERVAALSPGGQRWLKTALHTIRTIPDDSPGETEQQIRPERRDETQPRRETTSGLEDVITGKAKLSDQLEAFPELAEELEGLGEVIDLLRGLGEERRKRGEQILREDILGDGPDPEEDGA